MPDFPPDFDPLSAPGELISHVTEFWPSVEVESALRISWLESGWDPFAVNDTRTTWARCGALLTVRGGIRVYAEVSYGYFQINACNYPDWPWSRFFNARHNAGTAHAIWAAAGNSWSPWYFSAKRLGLI